jgi:hypothetical protein
MVYYPKDYYINSFEKRGYRWNLTTVKSFNRIKDKWIKNGNTGYQSIYAFVDKDKSKVYYNYWFLDFDVDDLEDLDACKVEVDKVAKILSKFYAVDCEIIQSGGRGYHLYVSFNKALILPVKVANSLSEVFYDFIHDCFNTNYLCESCRRPAKRIKRIPGTVHENGNKCEFIKEYKAEGEERLDLLIQKKLIDIISEPKQPKKYIEPSARDGLFDLNSVDLKEVYKDVGNHLIVDDNSDHLVIKHPVHLETRSDSNGVVGSFCSTCYSTNETFNKWDSLMQVFNNNKSKLIEYLIEKYPTRKSNA